MYATKNYLGCPITSGTTGTWKHTADLSPHRPRGVRVGTADRMVRVWDLAPQIRTFLLSSLPTVNGRHPLLKAPFAEDAVC